MKSRVYFENKNFRVFLISYLLLLILYNGYNVVFNFPNGWSPAIINMVILILVMAKSKYLKNILRIWSGIFLVFFPLMQVISSLFKFFLDGEAFYGVSFLMALFFIIVGVIIFTMSKTVKNIKNNSN